MSTLVDRSGRPPTPGAGGRPKARRPGRRSAVATGALTAVQAATASLVVILIPVVLVWATAAYSQAPWSQALQVGVSVWLLAHHTAISIPGGQVGLMPIGLTMIPLITCWFAGVRLARTLDPKAEAIRAGIGRVRPRLPPPRALLALVLTYAGLVSLAAALAASASVRPAVVQAFFGSALICCLGAAAGVGAWVEGGVSLGIRRVLIRLRLPRPLGRCIRPVALVLTVQLTGALVLFLVALVAGWHRILLEQQSLHAGLVGGLVLVIAQLAVVPNLMIWAGAYTAGPGFAVGVGTSVAPGVTHLGALPAVPLLGVLPPSGDVPGWGWAVLIVPVLAGVLAGGWIVRRGVDSVQAGVQDCGLTGLLAGAAWIVLGWLSGGPAGPGRLAQLGPEPGRLGLAVAVEVGAGAMVVLGIVLISRRLAAVPEPIEPPGLDWLNEPQP